VRLRLAVPIRQFSDYLERNGVPAITLRPFS
jgi:hypothetical protein